MESAKIIEAPEVTSVTGAEFWKEDDNEDDGDERQKPNSRQSAERTFLEFSRTEQEPLCSQIHRMHSF